MDGFVGLPNGAHDSLQLFSGPMFAPPPGEADGLTLDDMFADDLFAMDGDSDADQSGAGQSGRTPSGDMSSPAPPSAAPGQAAPKASDAGAPAQTSAPRRSRRARAVPSPVAAAAEAPATAAARKATAKSSKGEALHASAKRADAGGNVDDDDDDKDDDDVDDDDDDDDEDDADDEDAAAQKRPRQGADGSAPVAKRPRRRAATQEERLQRSRERNRIHARKSRLRKKFFVDSLKASLDALEEENKALRAFVRDRTGMTYEELAKTPIVRPLPAASSAAAPAAAVSSTAPAPAAVAAVAPPPAAAALPQPATAASGPARSLVGGVSDGGTRHLERQDFALMSVLQSAQQNFVVSDPNMEDNPIVFASQGFYDLTGYTPAEVISRNCRFLQGPLTDPSAVAKIRDGIRAGRDVSVCLINYKRDGTPFWNQFFVAPLRDVHGRVVNFVGVQCAVTKEQAGAIHSAEAERTRGPASSRQLPSTSVAPPASQHPAQTAAAAPPAARVLPALLPGEDAFPIAPSSRQ